MSKNKQRAESAVVQSLIDLKNAVSRNYNKCKRAHVSYWKMRDFYFRGWSGDLIGFNKHKKK